MRKTIKQGQVLKAKVQQQNQLKAQYIRWQQNTKNQNYDEQNSKIRKKTNSPKLITTIFNPQRSESSSLNKNKLSNLEKKADCLQIQKIITKNIQKGQI